MLAHITHHEFPILIAVVSLGVGIGIGIGVSWALWRLRGRRNAPHE